jgi:chemotaxis protein methyltransferase WspC
MDELKNRLRVFFNKEIGLDIDSLGENIFERAIKQAWDQSLYSKEQFYLEIISKGEIYEKMLDDLTVGETWFMREDKALEECYQILSKKGSYNILSLPCSTGEEPYSILISLMNKGVNPDKINIFGIDINKKNIDKAQKGVFKGYSFRKKTLECDGCFELLDDGKKRLLKKYREKVIFKDGNLLDQNLAANLPKFDAIFCRNILIYFTTEAKIIALANIKSMLKPGGIVLSGHSEIMIFLGNGFAKIRGSSFALKAEEKVAELPIIIAKPVAIPKLVSKPKVRELIEENDLENPDKKEEILLLANNGVFREAESKCEEYIIENELDSQGYYLMGLLKEAQANEADAIQYYNKAIYLNPNHYESLINLSLIHKKNGEFQMAEQFRLRAEKSEGKDK